MKIVKLSNFTIRFGAGCSCWGCPKSHRLTLVDRCAFSFMCFGTSKHRPIFLNYKN